MTDDEILAFRLRDHLHRPWNCSFLGLGHNFDILPATVPVLLLMHDYLHRPDQEPNHWHPRRQVVLRFLGLVA